MKLITDPELIRAFQKREMQVEFKLNIIRAYAVLFFTVLDIIIAWFSGMFNINLTILFIALGLVFVIYFILIHFIATSKNYYPWLKYITVTVDYLFVLAAFWEYRYTNFFKNMPDEVVVFHFITFIIFINILSVARYSRTVILYSTFLGISAGSYLLIRYVPVSWSTWFTTLLILFSGLITFLFSSDLNSLFLKLRKREKLNKFLSKKIVQSIDNGLIDFKLGGAIKKVTVLFSDIRNFVEISETKDALDIVATLNEYFTEMTNIIFKYDGMIDKYIGDSIMAVFGIPASKPNDALRAVQASIEMQQCLDKLNLKWMKQDNYSFKTGIAIHTGTVVAGNIGSSERMEYTVIGNTVNLASRIEGMNKIYKTDILLSESTYNHIKKDIDVEFIAEAAVRGKAKPIKIYTIKEKCIKFEEYVDVAHLLNFDKFKIL